MQKNIKLLLLESDKIIAKIKVNTEINTTRINARRFKQTQKEINQLENNFRKQLEKRRSKNQQKIKGRMNDKIKVKAIFAKKRNKNDIKVSAI